jgi:hypothetical protein
MTRIDFKIPSPLPHDAQQVEHQQMVGKGHATVGISLMLNGDKSGAAAVAGTVSLVKVSLEQATDPKGYLAAGDARFALRELAKSLINTKGQVQSGYMSLSTDGKTLSNTSRWSSGDRDGAISTVRGLIQQAYGHRMAALGMNESLDAAIDRYLDRSGGKLGTRSLVALVRDLECKLIGETEFLAGIQVGKARLDIQSVQAESLPRHPDQALKKLLDLYEEQEPQLLEAEKAVIQREYPWAEGTQVGEMPISYGQQDYRITGFADFKVMERLAQERRMAPEDFMALLQRQGPDVLIDPAGRSHPANLGKQLYQNMVAAFNTAATLDDFHETVSELSFKTFDALRAERAALTSLPHFPAGTLQGAAVQALKDLGAGLTPQQLAVPTEAGSAQWPQFEMPQWQGQEAFSGAQALYRWGTSLLFTGLKQQGRSDDLGPLNDLLQDMAGQALDGDSAIEFAEELERLIGSVPAQSALAFGRDCLVQALSWGPGHALPYENGSAPADHPLSQLRRHPFLRASDAPAPKP